MANVYEVGFVGANGPYRFEVIVTDTLQSAMSIAKAHCKWDEEIDRVDCRHRDVTIDHAAIGTAKQ